MVEEKQKWILHLTSYASVRIEEVVLHVSVRSGFGRFTNGDAYKWLMNSEGEACIPLITLTNCGLVNTAYDLHIPSVALHTLSTMKLCSWI